LEQLNARLQGDWAKSESHSKAIDVISWTSVNMLYRRESLL